MSNAKQPAPAPVPPALTPIPSTVPYIALACPACHRIEVRTVATRIDGITRYRRHTCLHCRFNFKSLEKIGS